MLTTQLQTPLGILLAASGGECLKGLWFLGQRHFPSGTDAWTPDSGLALFSKVADALEAYFEAGDFIPLPLDPEGTPFQRSVWNRLRAIPKGEVRSYAAIATETGNPAAARAAGAAVGRNPISIFIPCHRVVGTNGALTGYAGGLDRKRALLAHEAGPVF